ncbi:cyclase family protein [Candidatus Entotheonella palauensis]|uniref:cyclase family protein n=1 Tax=Candidatus Entotheonella palauensis TaxID=93172 RepID=UPI0035305392
MTQTIIDLSHNLDDSTPPFPGDDPVHVNVVAIIPADHPPGEAGAMNVSQITTGVHVGTHIEDYGQRCLAGAGCGSDIGSVPGCKI